jgi:hypothetical protein
VSQKKTAEAMKRNRKRGPSVFIGFGSFCQEKERDWIFKIADEYVVG